MTIRTLFFDIGGVLVNFSHEKMCENIAELGKIDLDIVKTHLFEKNLGEMYERGVIDSHTLHEHFCQLAGFPFSFDSFMESAAEIFSPKEEMLSLLENLKKQNYKLYILSNTCEAHISYMKKHFDFLPLFDGYVLSYEANARKPEKAIYDYALKKANSLAEESFYTDDISEYIVAAKNYGFDAHHFENRDSLAVALSKRGIDV